MLHHCVKAFSFLSLRLLMYVVQTRSVLASGFADLTLPALMSPHMSNTDYSFESSDCTRERPRFDFFVESLLSIFLSFAFVKGNCPTFE